MSVICNSNANLLKYFLKYLFQEEYVIVKHERSEIISFICVLSGLLVVMIFNEGFFSSV